MAILAEVEFAVEPDLNVNEFIQVLVRSTLGERRPVQDRERMQVMLDQADVIVTARHHGQLVGVSRAITDFSYCTYLSDLAVSSEYQRQGIGRELLLRTHQEAGFQTRLVLIAAPGAVTYYPAIGLEQHPSCWTIAGRDPDVSQPTEQK